MLCHSQHPKAISNYQLKPITGSNLLTRLKLLQHYGGSFNGCLKPGSFFVLFVRGSIKNGNTLSHIVSDYISTVSEPDIAEFFHTEIEPKVQIMQLGIGLLAGVIVITATLVVFVKRRQRRHGKPKYSAVEDEGSGSSDIDEISVQRSLSSSAKRRKLVMQNPTDKKKVTATKVNSKTTQQDTLNTKSCPSSSKKGKGSSSKNSTVKNTEDTKKDSENERQSEDKHGSSFDVPSIAVRFLVTDHSHFKIKICIFVLALRYYAHFSTFATNFNQLYSSLLRFQLDRITFSFRLIELMIAQSVHNQPKQTEQFQKFT